MKRISSDIVEVDGVQYKTDHTIDTGDDPCGFCMLTVDEPSCRESGDCRKLLEGDEFLLYEMEDEL